MKTDLISVIIPTHNRLPFLKRAVDSVINQTFKNIEIIIVDDGSTDGTEKLYQATEDRRIRYVRIDKPRGGNFARNIGVENSRGDLIAFLDDDDEWLPNKLERQLFLFSMNASVGLVYTGIEVINVPNRSSYHIKPRLKGDLSKAILTYNYIGTTSSVMLRKNVFNDAGCFDIDMPQLQDYDLWIRICQICKIDFVSESLIKYYVHSNGTQVTSSISKNQSAIEIIDRKYEKLFEKLSDREKRMRFCQRYNAMGKRLLNNGDRAKSREYFFQSFRLCPNIVSIKFYIASFFNYKFLVKVRNLFSS